MYVAEYGRWPEKLDDVTLVSVPRDPFTGQPFEYSCKNELAMLSTPRDNSLTASLRAAGAIRYELELRRPTETKSEGK